MEQIIEPGNRLTNVINWFFTKIQGQLNGERTGFPTNGARIIAFQHEKTKMNWSTDIKLFT